MHEPFVRILNIYSLLHTHTHTGHRRSVCSVLQCKKCSVLLQKNYIHLVLLLIIIIVVVVLLVIVVVPILN